MTWDTISVAEWPSDFLPPATVVRLRTQGRRGVARTHFSCCTNPSPIFVCVFIRILLYNVKQHGLKSKRKYLRLGFDTGRSVLKSVLL